MVYIMVYAWCTHGAPTFERRKMPKNLVLKISDSHFTL